MLRLNTSKLDKAVKKLDRLKKRSATGEFNAKMVQSLEKELFEMERDDYKTAETDISRQIQKYFEDGIAEIERNIKKGGKLRLASVPSINLNGILSEEEGRRIFGPSRVW